MPRRRRKSPEEAMADGIAAAWQRLEAKQKRNRSGEPDETLYPIPDVLESPGLARARDDRNSMRRWDEIVNGKSDSEFVGWVAQSHKPGLSRRQGVPPFREIFLIDAVVDRIATIAESDKTSVQTFLRKALVPVKVGRRPKGAPVETIRARIVHLRAGLTHQLQLLQAEAAGDTTYRADVYSLLEVLFSDLPEKWPESKLRQLAAKVGSLAIKPSVAASVVVGAVTGQSADWVRRGRSDKRLPRGRHTPRIVASKNLLAVEHVREAKRRGKNPRKGSKWE
jgi:hypothetical protein